MSTFLIFKKYKHLHIYLNLKNILLPSTKRIF